MKYLVLIRHAKSSWGDPSLKDVDRPLNERGKEDAPQMAKRLAGKRIKINKLVSSPAKRARQTANLFAKEFDFKKEDILLDLTLYEAGVEDFLQVVSDLKDKWDVVALFSHNPGITSFANSLTDTHIDDMPTCGLFAVKIDVKKWADFPEAKKEFWFFDYPKSH